MKKLIGKLLIIFLPVLVAAVLLYPTYQASELEKMQKEVLELAKKDSTSADSLARIENFEKEYGEALHSAKQSRLKLGLDLRGGMYVTLEVDVLQLIEETAQQDAIDDVFLEVLNKTRNEASSDDKDIIDQFKENFDQIARPKKRFLSDYYDFGDENDVAASEDKIIQVLKDNETDAIDQAMEVIRQRIDKYGIAEPSIQKVGGRRILLELPGVTNENEMRKLLQTTARLEFNLVKNDENLASAFYKIDALLAKQNKLKAQGTSQQVVDSTQQAVDSTNQSALKPGDSTLVQKKDNTAVDTTINKDKAEQKINDSLKTETKQTPDTSNPYAGLSQDEASKRYLEDHPFTTLFETYYVPPGKNQKAQQIGYAVDAFTPGEYNFSIFEGVLNRFFEILNRPEVKNLLPDGIKIMRSAKPEVVKDKDGKEFKLYNFYSLKKEPELTGEVITNAQSTYDPTTNEPLVLMSMNSDGSERWAKITGANIGKRVAIVLDDQVYSAPVVQNKIVGGSSQITGMSDAEEAKLLKIVLKAGALQAPVKIIEERIVGPSLGEDSILSGFTASGIAAILVVLFMAIYYNKAGLIADFAVILNIILVLSVLSAFQGTLTLPGIAGIILTIGMAVDANILIYERIREELARGRSIRSAVDEGFSKALSAILDSNITTFITGLILFFVGTGPIQGFAMTLMIGILGTLFTAILVSKAVIEIFISRGATTFNFGQAKVINS